MTCIESFKRAAWALIVTLCVGCPASTPVPVDVGSDTARPFDVTIDVADVPEGDTPLADSGALGDTAIDVPNAEEVSDAEDATGSDGSDVAILHEESSLTLSTESALADGLSVVEVHVTVIDETGAAVVGAPVHISTDGAQGVIVTQPLATDATGQAVGELVAIDGGTIAVSATAVIADVSVPVGETLNLTFTGCTTTADHYRRNLRGPVFSICTGCHRPMGLASEWGIWSIEDRIDDKTVGETLATLGGIASMKVDDISVLLAKPSGLTGHQGGLLIASESRAYAHLEALVERLEEGPDSCKEAAPDFLTGVEGLSDVSTLRRAAFKLVGGLPLAEELDSLNSGTSLKDVVQQSLLMDSRFYERFEVFFNDLLLTDRILGSFKLLSHLAQADFPNRFTFRPFIPGKAQYNKVQYTCEYEPPGSQVPGTCCENTADAEIMCEDNGKVVSLCDLGDKYAIYGLRRQAIALMTHVVKNDLPFNEILTADYVMVNPVTMRVFRHPNGDNHVDFEDPCDLTDWKPVKLKMLNQQGVTEQNTYPSSDIPHAGILSTHTFLNRYTTTISNLNRHRASQVLWKFLDFDIGELVAFTVGQDETLPANPTQDGFVCSVCHSAMDPVAGAFVKWTGIGRVRRDRTWEVCTQYLPNECNSTADCDDDDLCVDNACVGPGYDPQLCVRPIGFAGETIEEPTDRAPLRWMAKRLAQDPRFPRAIVKHLLTSLTDRDWLKAPGDREHPGYAAHARAYIAQEEEVERITAVFVTGDLNVKVAIAEIIVSPWFGAAQLSGEAVHPDALVVAQIGGGRLHTPMMLNDKIKALTGFPWSDLKGRTDVLLSTADGYRVLYGGIDSKSIVNRARDPFAVASAVARRMSLEMGCLVVPQDMAWLEPKDRRFFENISLTTLPENEAGEPINKAAIDATIATVHETLLNEKAPPGSPAYEETYGLLVNVWKAGKARLDAGTESTNLPSPCQATMDAFTGGLFVDDPGRVNVKSDPDYVIRSWMAVMSYLLSDARFLMTAGGE
jgi:hypothetical protein